MPQEEYIEVVCRDIPQEVKAGIDYCFTSTAFFPRLPLNDLMPSLTYVEAWCIMKHLEFLQTPAGNSVTHRL